jgi:hypothetical protein
LAERHFTGNIRAHPARVLPRPIHRSNGSDIILGPTMIDEGSFRIAPKKTGKRIGDLWIAIEPPLAVEMATWERKPGPLVPLSKKMPERHFAAQRDQVPELAGTTLHGLRAAGVVELRLRGHDTLEMSAQVGMSDPAILPVRGQEAFGQGCGTEPSART